MDLRKRVGQVYAESVEYSRDYAPKIERLLDTHVVAKDAKTVVPMFAIYDKAFEAEIDKMKSKTSKALTMLHRTKKFITENIERDKRFYERFSILIEETLEEYKKGRLSEADLLAKAQDIKEKVLTRTGDDIPEILEGQDVAKAYYGDLKSALGETVTNSEQTSEMIAKLAIEVDRIVKSNIIVDWVKNVNVQNKIKNEIEDRLFDFRSDIGVDFDYDTVDHILERVINTAKVRCPK